MGYRNYYGIARCHVVPEAPMSPILPLLLAAFLAIVVVGGVLVALHDALQRLWSARGAIRSNRAPVRSPNVRRPGSPVVAWRHLH
jgi:hypothetical protein